MFAVRCLETASVLLMLVAHTSAFAPSLGGAANLGLRQSGFACASTLSSNVGLLESRLRAPSAVSTLMTANAAPVKSESGLARIGRTLSLRTVIIGLFVVLSAAGANMNGASNNFMAHAPAPVVTSSSDAVPSAELEAPVAAPSVAVTAEAAAPAAEDKGFDLVNYLRKNRDSMGYALAGIFSMAAFGIPSTVCLFMGTKIGGVLGSLFICAGSLLALFRTIDLIKGPKN